MREFIKKNKINLLIILLVGIFIYFNRMFFYTISIDTERLINNPNEVMQSWLGIGRFGLVFLKKILELVPINISFTNIATFIIWYFSIIIWIANVEKWQKKENKMANLVFGLTLMSSPILAEQFGFTLQSLEISIAFLCTAIGFFLEQKWLHTNKLYYLLFSIICITISFSCYQAFIILYITICVFDYIIKYDGKMDYKQIGKYILVFIIALFLYYGINIYLQKTMQFETTSYLQEQINWEKESFLKVFIQMFASIGVAILGIRIENNLAFLLIFLAMSIYMLKNIEIKKNKMFYLIYLFLFVTPFLTTILKGNSEVYRAKFSFAFLIAFGLYYLIDKVETSKGKKIVKYIAIYTIVVQTLTSAFFFYADYKRYKEDVELAYSLNEVIKTMNTSKPVVVIGKKESKEAKMKAVTLGHSFFAWDAESQWGVNVRANSFFKTLQIEYILPNLIQIEQAKKEAEEMPIWPESGSIIEQEEYIIVHLSN